MAARSPTTQKPLKSAALSPIIITIGDSAADCDQFQPSKKHNSLIKIKIKNYKRQLG
jgi:hypothetical protein